LRRKDREVSDLKTVGEILDRGRTCHLAFYGEDEPYVVPLCYGYQLVDGRLTLYFHAATEGKKLSLMRENPCVGFCVSTAGGITTGPVPCAWSMDFESVMGAGVLSEVSDETLRKRGMDLLMAHYGLTGEASYEPDMVKRTVVLCLKADRFSAKRRGG
jgi:nitroimidazol reductase NimA-like FMN-containing flavoprotein (pyridoxamine 5'-phosphate oxidase superfamily)